MDIEIWAKTLLSAYGKLSKAIANLDEGVDKYVNKCFYSTGGAEKQLKGLVKILSRRKNLEYAKACVGRIINANAPILATLTARHCDGKSYREIAESAGVNIRTVFRRYDKEIKLFAEELELEGLTSDECDAIWGEDILMLEEMKRVIASELSYSSAPPLYILSFNADDIADTRRDKYIIETTYTAK